jgi:putative resolvase
MNTLITIREASDLLGVSTKTLRRWEQQGKIASFRTPGGHRRFRQEELFQSSQETPSIIGYARINRPEQKSQLDTQVKALAEFCSQQSQAFEILTDIDNGVTYNRPNFIRLIEMICNGGVKCLVLTHAESLSRFCHDFIFGLCNLFNTRVILLNQPYNLTTEADLLDDIQALVTICYNRLYGLHNPAHQQLLDYLQALKDIRLG